jgi:ribosomal protein S27E
MAQVVRGQEALPKKCHFHGDPSIHRGTHIMRINCSLCGDYQVVYVCEQCTATIRSYEGKPELTVGCNKCNRPLQVQNHWTIRGEE